MQDIENCSVIFTELSESVALSQRDQPVSLWIPVPWKQGKFTVTTMENAMSVIEKLKNKLSQAKQLPEVSPEMMRKISEQAAGGEVWAKVTWKKSFSGV